jgi:hypothetical protein
LTAADGLTKSFASAVAAGAASADSFFASGLFAGLDASLVAAVATSDVWVFGLRARDFGFSATSSLLGSAALGFKSSAFFVARGVRLVVGAVWLSPDAVLVSVILVFLLVVVWFFTLSTLSPIFSATFFVGVRRAAGFLEFFCNFSFASSSDWVVFCAACLAKHREII